MALTTIFEIPDEPLPGDAHACLLLTAELRRRFDHDRTVQALTALGYPVPTPGELAEAAAMRADTMRRQASRTLRPVRS